jgi:hypothetical protein
VGVELLLQPRQPLRNLREQLDRLFSGIGRAQRGTMEGSGFARILPKRLCHRALRLVIRIEVRHLFSPWVGWRPHGGEGRGLRASACSGRVRLR